MVKVRLMQLGFRVWFSRVSRVPYRSDVSRVLQTSQA